MDRYSLVIDNSDEFQQFQPDNRDQAGVYYMTWHDLIERFRALGMGVPRELQNTEDFDFENLEDVLVPPPLPDDIPIRLVNRVNMAGFYDSILPRARALGLASSIENYSGLQGEVMRQRTQRAFDAFVKGMELYFKMLRFLDYPVQLCVRRNNVMIRLMNQTPEEIMERLQDYAAAYFVGVQVGRKMAINSFISADRDISINEFVPHLTFNDYIGRGNVIRPDRWPDFLRDSFSPVYWYMSSERINDHVASIIGSRPNRNVADFRYRSEFEFFRDIQVQLTYLYGANIFNMIYREPNVNLGPGNSTRTFIDRSTYRNTIPERVEQLNRDDLVRAFQDREAKGIVEMYLRFLGRQFHFQLGLGDRGRNELREEILARARADIEESDEYYNEVMGGYEVMDLYDNVTHTSGGVRLFTFHSDAMWPIDTNEPNVVQQTDIFFRLFYLAYLKFKDNFVRFHGDDMEGVGEFMNAVMTRIQRIRVLVEMRIEDKHGNPADFVAQGRTYENDDVHARFSWEDTVTYSGMFPVNFYNFLLSRVWVFWERLAEHYQSFMNSWTYRIQDISITLHTDEPAGGCVGDVVHNGITFLGFDHDNRNNCFFKAINGIYDVFNMTKGDKLTLSKINEYRKKAGIKERDAVRIIDIPKMGFDFPFGVVNGNGETLYSQGDWKYFIILHEGHYYVMKSQPDDLYPVCERCKGFHDPSRTLECAEIMDRFREEKHDESKNRKRKLLDKNKNVNKWYDYRKFVRFSTNHYDDLVKIGSVNFITADIETFPDESKKHIPYSIAFKVPEAIEWQPFEEIEDLGEGVGCFTGPGCIKRFLLQLSCIESNSHIVFHNGSRYDFILIMEELMMLSDDIKFHITNLMYKSGKIMSFKMTQICKGKSVVLTFWDSCLHLLASLDSCCKIFKVPDSIAKGSFDHEKIKDGWEDVWKYESEWRPYLRNDILALEYIVKQYEKEIIESLKVSPLHFTTISSLANYKIKMDCHNKGLKIYVPKDYREDDFFRKAIYGGRTMPVKRNFDSQGVDDYLIALDVKSLYPYAMHVGEFFMGEPTKFDRGMMEPFKKMLSETGKLRPGIYSTKVKPPPQTRRYPIPFLPMRSNTGDLLWQYKSGEGHYSNRMIEYAIKLGYEFELIEAYVFESTSSDVFKDSNNHWQNMKDEAERVGNEGRRQIAKIANNSGYGKQMERPITNSTLFTKKEHAILLMNRMGYQNVKIFSKPETDNCFVTIQQRPEAPQTPCHLGIIILDESKIIMYEYYLKSMVPYGNLTMEQCFDKAPYYSDTDSAYVPSQSAEAYADSLGDVFGKLDYDLKEKEWRIYTARFHAPKTYSFEARHIISGKVIQKKKTKGFPDKSITYEQMMDASRTNTPLTVEFKAMQRVVFNKINYKEMLSIKNTLIKRVLDLNCFKKCFKVEVGNQVYFVPFFDTD